MVAGVALEPPEVVGGAVDGTPGPLRGAVPPPALLTHALDAAPPLPPVRADPALTAMHEGWSRAHATPAGAVGDGAPGGWRGRVSGFVARAARRAVQPAQAEDRAMIGDLIRATDTLAARCDALADRVATVERALAEVVEVLGADVARLRADVASRPAPAGAEPRAGVRPPDG